MLKKYKVVYDEKVITSGSGEAETYILNPFKKTIRANTFGEARDKIRKSSAYEVINIYVEEDGRKSWLKRIIKKIRN